MPAAIDGSRRLTVVSAGADHYASPPGTFDLHAAVRAIARISPRAYWGLRRARSYVLACLPPIVVAGIPGRVSRADLMLDGRGPSAARSYASVGADAVRFISASLGDAAVSWPEVSGCLDYGCGYGRVLRHLVMVVRPSVVTVCDIDRAAARFCGREFGVRAVGAASPNDLDASTYDLIFVGSVLTHVSEVVGRSILAGLVDRMRPGGVLVFSTHGRHSLLLTHDPALATVTDGATLSSEFENSGYAYSPYWHYGVADYGLTWYAPESVADLGERWTLSLKLLRSECGVWGAAKQDLWAFRKLPQ